MLFITRCTKWFRQNCLRSHCWEPLGRVRTLFKYLAGDWLNYLSIKLLPSVAAATTSRSIKRRIEGDAFRLQVLRVRVGQGLCALSPPAFLSPSLPRFLSRSTRWLVSTCAGESCCSLVPTHFKLANQQSGPSIERRRPVQVFTLFLFKLTRLLLIGKVCGGGWGQDVSWG